MKKKLYRSRTDRVLGGVCTGLAEHFNVDPVLIRVIFIAAALGGGFGVLAYIIFWIVTPEAPFPAYEEATASEKWTDRAPENTGASVNVTSNSKQGSLIAGSVLILLGALFLADEFLPDFDFGRYWPLILIFIGIGLLLGLRTTKKEKDENG
jgi:phage shock protein PspC (stress-responsive transcriptional regulator)